MVHTISNSEIEVAVKAFGAEWCSLKHLASDREYVWQAGAEWPKHAPWLFPIVGTLKDNKYTYNGREYTLPRHGFAREKNFNLVEQTENHLLFRLTDDEVTHGVFPFSFVLEIGYTLKGSKVEVSCCVINPSEETLWFSLGGHPAFRVPLFEGEHYESYFLQFDQPLTANRWPLENGLIASKSIPCLENATELALSKELFKDDALVFKKFSARSVALRSQFHNHGFEFRLNDCPYLGLWAAKGADFICIEPWYGIADGVNAKGELTKKEGINKLEPGAEFRYSFEVNVF